MMFVLGFLVAEAIAVGLFVLALYSHGPFFIVPKHWAQTAERWEWWRQDELSQSGGRR